MMTIPSAKFSKPNWLELYLKHCSVLTNGKCGTILIGDSIVAGLSRNQNIWNRNFSFNTLNCSIGGNKVQNVLWWAHNLPAVKSIRNVVTLCDTNNLHLDEPEDITDGITEIGSTFKRLYTNVNVFICGIWPRDCYWFICKRNFEIKECLAFVQVCQSRHQLNSGQWFRKSRSFLFWQNSSGRKG